MSQDQAEQPQAAPQEPARDPEMPGAFPEETAVSRDWMTFTDADWEAWEEGAEPSSPSPPASEDYFTAEEQLDSGLDDQPLPGVWQDQGFARVPQAAQAEVGDPTEPYMWSKILPFQPQPGPPPQTPYQPYSQPYRAQYARPFYPSPPSYAPMAPSWQQPSFPPPQQPNAMDPMQLILMNQMMMQQMAQQQQQMYAAQMMAMQGRPSSPCAGTGPVNVQACGSQGGGQGESGLKVVKRVPSTPKPAEAPPPAPEVQESKDVWQEASIILCLLVVIFVYLLSNSKDKTKKESERALVSRVMR